ncbi:MAG: DUF835 domain-containing protein [Methanomassiliicoccales archaeon]
MSEEKACARSYLKGYEEGLNEAWKDLASLTSRGHSVPEIQLLVRSYHKLINEKIVKKRNKIESELGLLDEAAAKDETEIQIPTVEAGSVQILKGKEFGKAFVYFRSFISRGYEGICITRSHPNTIRKKYNLDVPMVWLTKEEIPSSNGEESQGRTYVSPTDLPRLLTILKNFISSKISEAHKTNKIILLEGVEYLITQNDFKNVLKFLQNLKDQITLSSSILLLPLDPGTFEQKDLNLLELEMSK